jgi:glycolate oxidase iron-sulfur subunit
LMRALERGEIGAEDAALVQHLDACLGCRGCEPVCPSGVSYGRGLEAARERLFQAHGLPSQARAVLGLFSRERLWRPLFTLARLFRATGIPRLFSGSGRLGFAMGMLQASAPRCHPEAQQRRKGRNVTVCRQPALRPFRSLRSLQGDSGGRAATVALFRGCVMDTLFSHVHAATIRTLEANGYEVIEIPDQVCCGALHEHAGDRESARALARQNLLAFADSADFVVVNSAGCGALLKDYGHLLGDEAGERLAQRVRDVSELLAAAGPRQGGRLEWDVAYDAPCHLQHAQRVHDAPLALLRAIPGLRLQVLPGSDRCCGSAGIYSLLRPDMARAVLDSKIESFASAKPRPALVATGNPGCLMQIGAGLAAAGLDIAVAHPVELLDWSYTTGGVY